MALRHSYESLQREVRSQSQQHVMIARKLCGFVKAGDIESFEVQVDSRNVNLQRQDGMSVLMMAARCNKTAMALHALSKGADVNSSDNRCQTALHFACRSGSYGVCHHLLNFGAEPNAKDVGEATPLMLAAENNHERIVALLLERGADYGAHDKQRRTALDRAKEAEANDAIRILKCRRNRARQEEELSRRRNEAWQMFESLKCFSNLECYLEAANVRKLFAELATVLVEGLDQLDSDEKAKSNLYKSLEDQCARLQVIVEYLLQEKEALEVKLGGEAIREFAWRKIPLWHPSYTQNLPGFVNSQSELGTTPLMACADANNLKAAQQLLSAGADVRITDAAGVTALHRAAAAGSVDVASLLIASGAEVDATCNGGNTPLMLAAANDKTSLVDLLLQYGASAAERNRLGFTALQWAQELNCELAADVLRSCKFSDWKKQKLLGRGKFGEVHRVVTDVGELLACKIVDLPCQDGEDVTKNIEEAQIQEAQILQSLQHLSIVRFKEVRLQKPASACIFTELIDGKSLTSLLKHEKLAVSSVRKMCQQLCDALNYMHRMQPHPILHRDINGNNIMVQADHRVKFIDFGLAMRLVIAAGSSTTGHYSTAELGTPNFMAPELVDADQKPRYSRQSDVWAFGCTVFFMTTGDVPYKECGNVYALPNKIKQGAPEMTSDSCSRSLREFYGVCVRQNPKMRASAAELLGHSFLVDDDDEEEEDEDEWHVAVEELECEEKEEEERQ